MDTQPVIVNGNDLIRALRKWRLERDRAVRSFKSSLYAFPGENKTSPTDAFASLVKSEEAIAHLEAAQSRYNEKVNAEFGGSSLPLSIVIKLIGSAERMINHWKSAVEEDDSDSLFLRRHTRRQKERAADTEYAERQMSVEQCEDQLAKACEYKDTLWQAIQQANSRKCQLPNVNKGLLV